MASSAGFLLCIMFVLEVIGQTMFSKLGRLPVARSLLSLRAVSGDLLCTNAGPTPQLRSEYNAIVEWVAKVRRLSAPHLPIKLTSCDRS